MDKIRRAFSNADGTPRTGLTVVAIPVLDVGSPQVAMPETSIGKSGIYASSAEVAHGTYKIQVNGVDTGDTQVVEPGLHMADYPSDGAVTASIDRSLSDSVRLSNFFTGDQSVASHANMASACALAALRGKKLILDADVTTTSAISVTGTLTIDLNGHTLTLGGHITASVRMVAMFGRVVTASGKYLRGVSSQLFLGVDFTGGGDEQIAEATSDHAVYVACPGISRTKFSGTTPNWTGPIVIGCDAAGTADRLMLGSRADKDTGNDRLIDLQTFVDQHINNVVTNSQLFDLYEANYLKLVNTMPAATRDALALGNHYGSVLSKFKTEASQDCDALQVINGYFVGRNLSQAGYAVVPNGGSHTPTGKLTFLSASGSFTLAKPADNTLVHELTVLCPSDITITGNFQSSSKTVEKLFPTLQTGGTRSALRLTWSPVDGIWFTSLEGI